MRTGAVQAHPEGTNPATGPNVPWTSGLIGAPAGTDEDPPQARPSRFRGSRPDATRQADVRPCPQVGGGERRYHVVITAQGSAVHWQSRVHYYWYLRTRADCQAQHGSDCQMGGFTRVLHSGQPDDLMGEIPTHVVQPLEHSDNKGCVLSCENGEGCAWCAANSQNHFLRHWLLHRYVVLNRPYAIVQWLSAAVFPERYVLMCEPDHVWLRPMPNLMASDARPAAFPFFYIEPAKKDFRHITEKFTGPLTLKKAESIAPMGAALSVQWRSCECCCAAASPG